MTISKTREEVTDSIYSNFDHVLDAGIEAQLAENLNLYAQHAAWDFCGYVWYDDESWHDEVWVYQVEQETLTGDTAMNVIEQANDKYGHT